MEQFRSNRRGKVLNTGSFDTRFRPLKQDKFEYSIGPGDRKTGFSGFTMPYNDAATGERLHR
jgi:hypothetical protein